MGGCMEADWQISLVGSPQDIMANPWTQTQGLSVLPPGTPGPSRQMLRQMPQDAAALTL